MGILRKNDVNEIVELLKKETDTERAKEYEVQLLNGLDEAGRSEMKAVLMAGNYHPFCLIRLQRTFSVLM